MRDEKESEKRKIEAEVRRELMVFESKEGEDSGKFAYVFLAQLSIHSNTLCDYISGMTKLTQFSSRWLVHSIAAYYNLNTWSVTVGNPARREAYVGIRERSLRSTSTKTHKRTDSSVSATTALPRPLWCLV